MVQGRLHDEKVAARLGLWLGVLFGVAFLTGLASHFLQHPTGWFVWPTRPVNLYRFSQGLHVISGTAAIPVLVAKLYTVYPRLFAWPPSSRSVTHWNGSRPRSSRAAFFELIPGVLNIADWYPWAFYFPTADYAVAYAAVGSTTLHVAVSRPLRRALGGPSTKRSPDHGGSHRGADSTRFGTSVAAVGAVSPPCRLHGPLLPSVPALAVETAKGHRAYP